MLIAFNKPFGVLSQFTDPDGRPTLADYIEQPDVYAAGRLDRDSEGLLLLTDDGRLKQQLSGAGGTRKHYLVQVEGVPPAAALQKLRSGLTLKDGPARAVSASLLAGKPGWLWKRTPPVRFRKSVPTSWLELVLDEGRNRQVRRMTAAVGLPALRLVRTQIGSHELAGLQPGEWRKAGRD